MKKRYLGLISAFLVPILAIASVSVTINGTSYTIPQKNEKGWGDNVTSWIQAASQHLLQKTGGTFTLSGEVNLGSSFGLLGPYYKSSSSNISTAGVLRLSNTDSIGFRNAANSGNLLLTPNASTDGVLKYNSVDIPTISSTHTLTNKSISGSTNTLTAIPAGSALTGQVPIANGGTGAATKAAGFDALSPMTTTGDVIIGGSSGTGTRLAIGSTSQVLTVVSGSPAWANVGAATAPTVQTFTSGSGTYTRPTSPTPLYIRVRMSGGGGGGGGSGNNDGGTGTTGGTSFFRVGASPDLLVANGGTGGTHASTAGGDPAGAAGGSASLGTGPIGQATTGGGGSYGINPNGIAVGVTWGGQGGTNPFGGAPAATFGGAGSNAVANTGAGGQGGGTLTASRQGGGGGGAGGYVNAIITSPSSTYSYSVGTGGAGGTAGTSGSAGGNGGSGIIIVEEFYQ